jgi:hypothetical protein
VPLASIPLAQTRYPTNTIQDKDSVKQILNFFIN